MSSFSGLSVGLSSLYAQRAGLELTGHNIANANTEGYSRQRVGMASDGGPLTPAIHSTYDGAGNGVTVTGFQRLRDGFLESRALTERGVESQLSTGQLVLSRVEGVLGEPSESGIAAQLADFWAGFDDVANKPTDLAARSQLLERAATVANGINGAMDSIDSQRASFQEQLVATVEQVNATAAAVADYNRAIQSATRSGASANDLLDKRDLLVQQLGQLAGVTVRPGEAGSVDVLVGGTAIVTGRTSTPLEANADRTGVQVPGAPATPLAVGGAAGGLVTGITTTLPAYKNGLATVATQLADSVNAVHVEGFDAAGVQGTPMFGVGPGGRLSVLTDHPSKVAASGPGTGPYPNADGSNALRLAALAGSAGGADETYRKLVVTLGVEAQAANRRVAIQGSILAQIDAARESQSGVSLDEEMTSMLAFQRAYEGAARFVSAVDSMLDTLINRTGLVGR